jgi:hypothetical protein
LISKDEGKTDRRCVRKAKKSIWTKEIGNKMENTKGKKVKFKIIPVL